MRVVLDTNQLVAALADFILTVDLDLMAPEVSATLEQMGISITTGANLIRLLDSTAAG